MLSKKVRTVSVTLPESEISPMVSVGFSHNFSDTNNVIENFKYSRERTYIKLLNEAYHFFLSLFILMLTHKTFAPSGWSVRREPNKGPM